MNSEPSFRAHTNYKIFQDWAANKNNIKGRMVLVLFRIARLIRHVHPVLTILGVPYLIFYRVTVEWILGIELPWNLQVGPRIHLYHGQALIVNDKTKIGDNVSLRQSTTIGAKVLADGKEYAPIIGNNVDVGSNVVILGKVVIGNNAVIGAGSVVVKDVPDNAVVAGNPAKILSIKLPD